MAINVGSKIMGAANTVINVSRAMSERSQAEELKKQNTMKQVEVAEAKEKRKAERLQKKADFDKGYGEFKQRIADPNYAVTREDVKLYGRKHNMETNAEAKEDKEYKSFVDKRKADIEKNNKAALEKRSTSDEMIDRIVPKNLREEIKQYRDNFDNYDDIEVFNQEDVDSEFYMEPGDDKLVEELHQRMLKARLDPSFVKEVAAGASEETRNEVIQSAIKRKELKDKLTENIKNKGE